MFVGVGPRTDTFRFPCLSRCTIMLFMGVWDWVVGQFLLPLGIWDRNDTYRVSFNVLLDESVYSLKYKLIKAIVLYSRKAAPIMCGQLFQKVSALIFVFFPWGLPLEPHVGKHYEARHTLLHAILRGRKDEERGGIKTQRTWNLSTAEEMLSTGKKWQKQQCPKPVVFPMRWQ